MNYRDDYPLSVWLDDVAEIIKRRDFVGKKGGSSVGCK